MIIKAVFYVEGTDTKSRHERILEVTDFHIETLSKEIREKDKGGIHELAYQTVSGETGSLRLGNHVDHADHLYVMENGKTVDHMTFNA